MCKLQKLHCLNLKIWNRAAPKNEWILSFAFELIVQHISPYNKSLHYFSIFSPYMALTPIISKYFFSSHYIIRQHEECISDKRKLLKLENRDLLCIMPVILAIGLIETWNCILVGKYFVTHIKKLLLHLKLVNLLRVWYFRKIAATFSDMVH